MNIENYLYLVVIYSFDDTTESFGAALILLIGPYDMSKTIYFKNAIFESVTELLS